MHATRQPLRAAPAAQRQRRERGAPVGARQEQRAPRDMRAAAFDMNKGPEIPDRILGSLPYLLPLLDTLPYGRFIFLQYPFVARALAPLGPLNDIYHLFPFAPFLIFLGVYSGIVNNRSLSRFTRYNAMQARAGAGRAAGADLWRPAVLLDILIIIPQLLLNAFGTPTNDGPLMSLYIGGANTIFLFVAVCTALGMGSCAVGQTARLPLVAEAADSQVQN
ncbi:MAG: hypothetical protein J3K34DRAFT_523440 [Monoraphidium minutum]|nr:MAG: hypothetical protein J3K34DRAFT_523440 [Monoraphidium minutum]